MPYSFTQIEKEKSRIVVWVFAFVILLYFLTFYGIAFLIHNYWSASVNTTSVSFEAGQLEALTNIVIGNHRWQAPSLYYTLAALLTALLAGFLHWWISTNDMIDRILGLLRAQPVKMDDSRHQVFKNVIDEVAVAIGGRQITGHVIPSSAMNAFAISDFEDNAVIGVTEGLLARLNRSQLEAVVGHEAAHIASGDSLTSSVAVSIFAVYSTILDGLRMVLLGDDDRDAVPRGRSMGRGSAGVYILLAFVYALVGFTQFLSMLMQMFVSRQRELRADVIAVRLTRNPLALAEALYAISYRWRGGGLPTDAMAAIFIVNPAFSELDEEQGLFPDLFSTHPPVKERLGILVDLAHADIQVVEDRVKKQEPIVSAPFVVAAAPKPPETRWMVCNSKGEWEGLYSIGQMQNLPWLTPDAWIKKEGGEITPAYMEPLINAFFSAAAAAKSTAAVVAAPATSGSAPRPDWLNQCPHCHVALADVLYEGVLIKRCNFCQGVLVKDNDDVFRIIVREEVKFSEDIVRLAQALIEDLKRNPRLQANMKGAALLTCPICIDRPVKMLRQFYSLAYPVEIDRCFYCRATWFDKDELELLQYMLEKRVHSG